MVLSDTSTLMLTIVADVLRPCMFPVTVWLTLGFVR